MVVKKRRKNSAHPCSHFIPSIDCCKMKFLCIMLVLLLASTAMVSVVHGQQKQQLGRRRRSLALFQLDAKEEELKKNDKPFTAEVDEMEAQVSALSYPLASCLCCGNLSCASSFVCPDGHASGTLLMSFVFVLTDD
jgi:uncharacterized protein YlxW (UPF0749 family)